MDFTGNLKLDDGGWSSGGFLADSRVTGQVNSGTQQQWISRNDQWGSWTGSNWNMVFVGDTNTPSGAFPNPPDTVVSQTPVVKEKPFLYIDSAGNYQVFVPALKSNSQATSRPVDRQQEHRCQSASSISPSLVILLPLSTTHLQQDRTYYSLLVSIISVVRSM